MLNSHGTDILMRPGVLEYRVIGGTLDLYFVAGPRAIDVHEQYSQIVGQTQPMPFWSFGFQLCRWGYSSVKETRDVVDAMRAANIPLEGEFQCCLVQIRIDRACLRYLERHRLHEALQKFRFRP